MLEREHAHPLADLGLVALVDRDLDGDVARLDRDEVLGAEVLEDRDRADDPLAVELPVEDGELGPGAEDHLLALCDEPGREARQRKGLAADAEAAAGNRRRQQVHPQRADEAGHEEIRGPLEHLLRRAELPDPARLHHGDPIGERERLRLVVGDVDGRRPHLVLQPLQERARLEPEPGVEIRERLVEQEELRPVGDRAGERDPLLLAARELRRPPREHRLEPEMGADLSGLSAPLRLRDLLDLERVGDVVDDGHVRVERVVLEDHGDVAGARGQPRHVSVADHDRAGGRRLEPGERPQQRRLPAARRTEEREELAVLDLDVELVDRPDAPGKDLAQRSDLDACHQRLIPPWKRKP